MKVIEFEEKDRQQIIDSQEAMGLYFWADHQDISGKKTLRFLTPGEKALHESKMLEIELRQSDLLMGRVTEDLITTLIDKGIITSGDLSPEAIARIARRGDIRETLAS